MNEPRYFVDQRIGCIAVRDRTLTEPGYPGLHEDTSGVVWYWHGNWSGMEAGWYVHPSHITEAQQLCNELNMIAQRERTGILQTWVTELGLRQQGVLVSIIRGCDSVPKEDPSKELIRAIRGLLLNTHCADPTKAVSFIEHVGVAVLVQRFDRLFKHGLDHYPLHWVTHLMHATEILGYYHPDTGMRFHCNDMYLRFCKRLHVRFEDEAAMNRRLNADEESFKWSQV